MPKSVILFTNKFIAIHSNKFTFCTAYVFVMDEKCIVYEDRMKHLGKS